MEQIPDFNILFVGKHPSRIIPILDHFWPRRADGNRLTDKCVVQFEHNGQAHSLRLCIIGFEGLENTDQFSIDQFIWQSAKIVVFVYSAGNQPSLDKIQGGLYFDFMRKKDEDQQTICFVLESHADGQDENVAAVEDVENNAKQFANEEGMHHLECVINNERSKVQALRLLAELHHQQLQENQ